MSTVKKLVDTEACPNCSEQITVPKSTRSFICRSCDAILRVFEKDDGVTLKVVGKSVEEDATYQALEVQIREVKTELDEMHRHYVAESSKPLGSAPGRLKLLGLVVLLAGLVAAAFAQAAGLAIAGAGFVAAVAGYGIRRARKRDRLAVLGDMSRTIAELGERRDAMQRRAALMKIEAN